MEEKRVITIWNECKEKAMSNNPLTFDAFLVSFLEAEEEVAKNQGFEDQFELEDYFHWHKYITEPLLDKFEKEFPSIINCKK